MCIHREAGCECLSPNHCILKLRLCKFCESYPTDICYKVFGVTCKYNFVNESLEHDDNNIPRLVKYASVGFCAMQLRRPHSAILSCIRYNVEIKAVSYS